MDNGATDPNLTMRRCHPNASVPSARTIERRCWLKTRPVRKSSEKPTRQRIAYGPREVSEMTGVSESGVRNLIYRGSLKAVRWDGRWLVPAHVLETYFGVQLTESTPPVSPTEESPTQ